MSGVQPGLTKLDFGVDPLDQFFTLFYVFAAPDGHICDPPAVQQRLIRDVTKVCQTPVEGVGFFHLCRLSKRAAATSDCRGGRKCHHQGGEN